MGEMRTSIAVMGTGALGGYYGARLMQAGHPVHFIARGAVLAALRRDGLRLLRDEGEIHLPAVSATDRPEEVGPVDLLLFTTKGQHLGDAVPAAWPLVAAATVVLPLLNGMDIAERVADGLGRGTVLGGLTYLPAKHPRPGVITQTGEAKRLVLGPLSPEQTEAAQRTATLLQGAGINAEYSESVRSEIWTKYIGYVAFAGTQCTSRRPIKQMLSEADSATLFQQLVREGQALAMAKGVPTAPDLLERLTAVVAGYPPGHNVSMFDDMQQGRPLELETTIGAAVQLGERLGVPTPGCARAYEALRPHAAGRA